LILVVTPAGETETPGGRGAATFEELGGITTAGDPFVSWAEQPATAATAARATALLQTRGRRGCHRTPSIYARLAAVMLRTRFWECCRP
jgi:hypothetical protein